jgi:hypothetical protein
MTNHNLSQGETSCGSFSSFQTHDATLASNPAASVGGDITGTFTITKGSNVTYEIEDIAAICHSVNKAYCEALGDFSHPHWDDAPDWQREGARAGVQFILDNPDAGPTAQHDTWMALKIADGWTYGPTKDTEAKTHPCLVPFDQLPKEQQVKDFLFRGVVRGFEQ